MKVLCVRPGPHFSVADVHRGWLRALRGLLGDSQVLDLNLDERVDFYDQAHIPQPDGTWKKALETHDAVRLALKGVEVACYEFQPDVVLVTSGFLMPPQMYELLRARGHRIVLLCTESPYEDDRQLRYAGLVDMVLLNDPTNLGQFRDANPYSYYVPHAYDPTVHHPRSASPDLKSDFGFVGTGYPSRVEFLEAVDWTGIDVALAGHWKGLDPDSPLRRFVVHDFDECFPNDDTADLYASTKASVNLYRREANRPDLTRGWAMGPREVELAAVGTFFLRDRRGESDDVLPMFPSFDGPEDFGDKLRWWLSHDDLRHKAAEKARQAVADRTFENHAARLLRLLTKE